MLELSYHTPGYLWRCAFLFLAMFVVGLWLNTIWQYRKPQNRALRQPSDVYLGAAVIAMVAGYAAINLEALFISPSAILLWGNFGFPLGLAAAAVWLIRAQQRLVRRRRERLSQDGVK